MSGDDNDDDWYSDYDPSVFIDDPDQWNDGDDTSYGSNNYGRNGGSNQRERRRYGGGGGGGGGRRRGAGGHDYTRDTSRDCSNVDEAAVDDLLSQRIDAKRRRDFDTADAIRDQLLTDYAVGVYDRERTWRTGCSASGSGMRRGSRRDGGGQREPRRKKQFGPNGHDYHPCEDAGPIASSLSEPEIHSLLAKRLEAKLSRNFDVADGIQVELMDNGVYVNDGMKEWRADGVPFGDLGGGGRRGQPGKTAQSRSHRNSMEYVKSVHSSQVEGAEDELINKLVMERSKCKVMRDYGKADSIREGLRTKFNVLIDDRLREWSVGGDFGEEHNAQRELSMAFRNRGVVKSASSIPLSAEDEAFVQMRVDERSRAKNDRNFDLADEIREELLVNFDVTIQDKLRQWSAGGDFGAEGGRRKKPRGVYTRRGGGDLSEEDVETITNLLKERSEAKKDRDFDTADEIRDALRNNWNVAVDDKAMEWRVDSDEYVQALNIGQRELSSEEIAIISAKLAERYQCKIQRDYEEADSIRDRLAEEFGVVIDDRNKEWKCVNLEEDAEKRPESFINNKETKDGAFDEISNGVTEEEMESVYDGSVVDESPPVLSEEELSSLTVPELKEKLRISGLRVSGKKAELIERLLNAA